jgi:hypothetical protein
VAAVHDGLRDVARGGGPLAPNATLRLYGICDRAFQCAVDCARSGQTLAIYDRDHDLIYFIAGELPGKNPNEPLMAYIHKKVDVTGMVYHRAGAYGIVIRKVVPHVEKPGSAPGTGATAPTK